MEYFKQRARQILIEQSQPEDYQYQYGEDFADEMAYEGVPMPLKLCYQNLKNVLKRPAANYGLTGNDTVPGYLKPTFSTQRNAHANGVQLQSMLGSLKNLKTDPALMSILSRQDSKHVEAEKIVVKSKREQEIDDKVERLLLAYKEKDELSQKKASDIQKEKKIGKKNLMEKFGFSDDEEEDVLQLARDAGKKKNATFAIEA